ncbi:MFS transporter, partial [Candidatus Sumerlaeota bacterium]|nr:MFS transporter [Candidatus Sumerlaeota bacterium]
QTLAMVQAFILAWLTLSGRVSFNQILGLCFALGIINSFDMPIRQSFVVEMVGRDDLPSAIALNSFMFNLARVIGPTIGGYAIKHISEGTIFGINSLSYLVVIFALALIKPIPFEREPARGNIAENITDGVKFVRSHLALRDALLYVGLISFMGLPYQMMMPAFAGKVFGRESQGFATMVTAIGLGALLGGIILVRFPSSYRIERLIPLAGMAFGLGLIALSVTPLIFPSMDRNFWLAVAVLVPTGGAIMTQTVCTNTFLQKLVPDRMRGRVLSFYTLMLLGLVPIGSLIAGYLAETIGLLNAARLGGAACVAGGFVVLTRMPLIRASAAKLLEEQHRDSAEFTAQTEI